MRPYSDHYAIDLSILSAERPVASMMVFRRYTKAIGLSCVLKLFKQFHGM